VGRVGGGRCRQHYTSIATAHPEQRVSIGASGLLDTLIEPVQGSTLGASVFHSTEVVPGDRLYILTPSDRDPAVIPPCL